MKILSAAQVREADSYTIENEPIASIDLMERASIAFTDWFKDHFSLDESVIIVCGMGNNGGDGLAVSRLLLEDGYNVSTYVIRASEKGSPDFMTNLERLNVIKEPGMIKSAEDISTIEDADVCVDAIFGSGLDRPVTGIFAEVIDYLNDLNSIRVAIDIASGLFADGITPEGAIFRADHSVSFQLPKLAFMMPSNDQYVGQWYTADIGLDQGFVESRETRMFMVDEDMAGQILRDRPRHSHKGDFGRSLIIAGSKGKMGAAELAASACMRSGAGLLTVHAPGVGYEILQTAVPEAMVSVDIGQDFIEDLPDLSSYTVVGVGPGIDRHKLTASMMKKLLSTWNGPLVIDADGLNILSDNSSLLKSLPEGTVLTPHPKEFERLAGTAANDIERWKLLESFCGENNVITVLKGANTAVCDPEGNIFFNSTGNPGMATGGSGDVLTGIITGLLSQGYNSLESALLGVFIHGRAGDYGASELGEQGLIASDIIDFLPISFLSLR